MENKVLIFKPQSKGFFNKSPLYAVPMFGKTLTLSSSFLLRALRKQADVAVTNDYLEVFWRLHFQSSFTSLYVTGRELLAPGETYIFMSNHESWMDIPAMFGAVPSSLRMVAKMGLTKIPIFGRALVNAGFIAVDRKNRHQAIKQLDLAKERLAAGISIWIAPEGTRSRDGSLAPFKKGGFYLAKQLKKSIVPVFIEGAAKVMPPDSLTVNANQSITVHFCKPIAVTDGGNKETAELINRVRSAIIDKKNESLKETNEVQG